MKKSILWSIGVVVSLSLLAGCSSAKVKRVDVGEPIDLSGRWNDTDSRLVAEQMLDDCLRRGWVDEFRGKNSRPPVVIVGTILNKGTEHIDSEVFTKALERNLTNAGKIKFVASRDERKEIRDERVDQQKEWTSPETRKAMKKETGADFMLKGSIHAVKDEIKSRYVILYQVDLEMIDLETNEKVWIGQHDIKKVVGKTKYSL